MPQKRSIQRAESSKRRGVASNPANLPTKRPRSKAKVDPTANAAFVVGTNGETTHVILPYDDYERLLIADMTAAAIARWDSSKPEDYVDADDVAIEFATEELVTARKKAGLTQKQLGEKIGVPQSMISRIERRPDRTTVRTLKRIAKALKVDVNVYIGRL